MVDYRDDYRPGQTSREHFEEHDSGRGTWIALALIAAVMVAFFWFGSGSVPQNGTQAPTIEATPPAPVAPEG